MENLEEAAIWRENTGLLYDYIGIHYLKTPSITCEWLNVTVKDQSDPEVERQLMFTGTHIRKDAVKNRLKLISVPIPKVSSTWTDYENLVLKPRPGNPSMYEGFGFDGHPNFSNHVVDTVKLYKHNHEPNRARVIKRENQNICATTSPDGLVRVYNLWEDSFEKLNEDINPAHELFGHSDECWSLEWCPYQEEKLISCGLDNSIIVWDLNKGGSNIGNVFFDRPPNDVAWTSSESYYTVDDAGALQHFDMRVNCSPSNLHPTFSFCNKDRKGLNSVLVPTTNNLVVAGGQDGILFALDRRMNAPVHFMHHHTATITEMQRHPTYKNIFASSDSGGKALVWNLDNIGKESEGEEDGPEELVFSHEGHRQDINDFRWNPLGDRYNLPYLCSTVGNDYGLQVFAPRPDSIEICKRQFHVTASKVDRFETMKHVWKTVQ